MPNLPALSKVDLQLWFDQETMILACVNQINKDLSAYDVVLHYSGSINNAYHDLYAQLLPLIDTLIYHQSTFMSILYRIDIEEKIIKTASLENESFAQTFTRLILWREMQKVVTRHLLSANNF